MTTAPTRLPAALEEDAAGIADDHEPLTGATPEAVEPFELACARLLAWRGGVDEPLAIALRAAPGFVMAHLLQAWLLVLGRDPRRVRRAEDPLASARRGRPRLRRERLHLAAIAAVVGDDYPAAKALLGRLLERSPGDLVALHAAHALDYLTGDVDRLAGRVAAVRPWWDGGEPRPGRHAVLSMHAFGLVERGEIALAERSARRALELNPLDARAHHAMAHVFEAADRPAEGAQWLERHADVWSTGTAVAVHGAWHLAVFRLALGDAAAAIEIADRRIPAAAGGEVADLVDASALLWRVRLAGGDVGDRFRPLAEAWEARIDDRFCSFSDIHAMLAFVGADDPARAQRLLQSLESTQSRPTRHGRTTRDLGLPACRAIAAFGRGKLPLAITLLASLPATAHRLGGSHAQRDVLHLTLREAVDRIRRPVARASSMAA